MAGLPERLDDSALALVDAMAALPIPSQLPASERTIAGALKAMNVLPRRKDDDVMGETRVRIYAALLWSYPDEALSFLWKTAVVECRFFPTPGECIAILNRWTRSDDAVTLHQQAKHRASKERQARFDEARLRLRRTCWGITCGDVTDEEIANWPEAWLRIFETEGWLRRREDGSHFLLIQAAPAETTETPTASERAE